MDMIKRLMRLMRFITLFTLNAKCRCTENNKNNKFFKESQHLKWRWNERDLESSKRLLHIQMSSINDQELECYCACIIEILRYFFILQSLTASKMSQFQPLKLSQFHKAKTCWTENWWSSGIMSNFWGEFFYVLGGKKKFFF